MYSPSTAPQTRDRASRSAAALPWPELLVALRGSTDLALWRACAARLRREREVVDRYARRRITLAILATHTTSFYAELLPVAALSVGIDLDVQERPYGQLEQQLIEPPAQLRAMAPDYVVLSGTAEDVTPGSAQDADTAVAAAVARWSGLAARARAGLGARVIQHTFVPGDDDPRGNQAWLDEASPERVIARINSELAARAHGDVLFVDSVRLAARHGRGRWRDPRYWHTVRQPVALDAVPLLARATAGVLAADLGLARRCLITDLDNTLWDGVISEAGPEGVGVASGPRAEGFAAFQEYLLGLRRLGMVLAVASKNDDALIASAFDQVPGMRLRYQDFACVQASWRPKSEQVRNIAEQLSLGLDSLVFVDDNPAECAEVLGALPSVDVVALPSRPAGYVGALLDRPTLTLGAVTAADRGRARSYTALTAAERERGTASLADFLSSLRMRAAVRPLETPDLDRAAQLVSKTNQFNLTGRRRSRDELARLIGDPRWICRTLRLADRFADHGMTGLIMLRVDGTTAEIDTLLLSCRVTGRTAEKRLLAAGAAAAQRAGCRLLRGIYQRTARNELVADLYRQAGFSEADGDGDPEVFLLDLLPAKAAAALDTPYLQDGG